MSRLGVSQIKDYVQSLPKNTVITRKLIQDFIEANNIDVNLENLFNKNRPAYVGNFINKKSIKVDPSYAASVGDTQQMKKAKAILNNPKLKKEFIKFGSQAGVSINDIRKKFNISAEEFYKSGLRNLFDKDFQTQAVKKIKNNTIKNMLLLHNNKDSANYIRKGLIVPDEIITKLGLNSSEAATATVRLAQAYGGQDFGFKELNKIRRNSGASDKLFKALDKFQFGNPYRSKLYNISLETIDSQLGNEKGTFQSLKNAARYILKKNNLKGFDINEIAGVTGTAKSGVGEFSQFIDIMDTNLNQKQMAAFQSAFSQARQNIKNNPKSFAFESKRINKLASRFENEYGVKLPRIRNVTDVEKYYSPKRLLELKDQGLDIKKASQKLGYTMEMPKGAITATEFVEQGSKGENFLNNFIQKVKSVPGGCRAIITRALGGPLDSCEAIIRANPEQAAIKLNNTITATKGPLKELKDDSKKLANLIDTGQVTTANQIPQPEKSILRDEFKEANVRWNNDVGAFETPNGNVATQEDLKLYAEENPMEVKVGTEPPTPNKSVLKTVGRTLAKVGTPLPTALIDGYFINKQMDEGKSTAEIAKDPLNWIGLAAMEPLSKVSGVAEKGGMNAVLRLGLNPATIRGISRFAGLPGLAISTAMTAYDQYKKYQNEEGFVYNLFNKEGN